MNPIDIINKYYPEENELRHILLTHSRSVADKSLWIADRHPELSLDKDFLYEAAMLHDIGIFLTAMLWFVNAIRVPDFHWRESLRRICPYRIVKWFRSAWKNKLSVLPISFIQKLIWKRRKV